MLKTNIILALSFQPKIKSQNDAIHINNSHKYSTDSVEGSFDMN